MTKMQRREFCSLAGALAAAAVIQPSCLLAEDAAVPVTLTVENTKRLATVPASFMGLSYESGQLSDPDFFSGQNTALVAIFRTLSPSGVLRLGGNLSEFTVWSDKNPDSPPEAGGLVGPDPGKRVPRTYTLTPQSIDNLKSFLDATGWHCIYGLNLGGGSLEQALAEGSYVAKTLGSKLICVQFGNEPDLFKHHDQGNKPWTYEEYITRWKQFRAAFHQRLPALPVAGPDTAFNQEWFKRFTEDVPKEVTLLTSHYYPEGPPTDPRMNIDLLLHPSERFDSSCRKPLDSAKAVGLPFRMSEGNSCYNAGKPGVSDTFASALWAGDFCLQMAAMGCVGVNLHGGANGFYSPIVGSAVSGFGIRPEYYGLLLAQEFAGSTLYPVTTDAQRTNVTAYAAGDGGQVRRLVVFNKDSHDLDVALSGGAVTGMGDAILRRLQAPAIDSKTDVTLGGASVAPDGTYHPKAGTPLKVQNKMLRFRVPAFSAAVIQTQS